MSHFERVRAGLFSRALTALERAAKEMPDVAARADAGDAEAVELLEDRAAAILVEQDRTLDAVVGEVYVHPDGGSGGER